IVGRQLSNDDVFPGAGYGRRRFIIDHSGYPISMSGRTQTQQNPGGARCRRPPGPENRLW
ncbi:MAG: hypothetical protein P4L76_08765, partial [Beijerinckiaceae bacterium]|nr:hypothetical protein [Beijerinckiaceae bacterium]